MRGGRAVVALLATAVTTVVTPFVALAQETTSPPKLLPVSPLIISAYSVMGEQPQYIEVYNDSKQPVPMAGWTVGVSWSLRKDAPTGGAVPAIPPITIHEVAGEDMPYIPPGGYVVVGFNGQVSNALSQITLDGLPSSAYVSGLELGNSLYRSYSRLITEAQAVSGVAMRLNVGAAGYTATYGLVNNDKIYQDKDYYYAPTGGFSLAPVEVLANPKVCSPLDKDGSCLEYVKFYNDTEGTVDFGGTRLRAGSSVVELSGLVPSGSYALFVISLSNSGGYIALEDMYGMHTYENTVIGYPDASATSKKGLSWALIDGVWQWATPNPVGVNTPIVADEEVVTGSLQPCRADQYRNPETNRCKRISSATSSLVPCAANQYRSSETNRCRNLTTATTSSLKPCAANQYRSPETNRCRNVAAANAVKPCATNQERNPATNRCRTKKQMAVADFPVEAVKDSAQATLGWWAFGGVGMMAAGYAGWEWRREMAVWVQKAASFIPGR